MDLLFYELCGQDESSNMVPEQKDETASDHDESDPMGGMFDVSDGDEGEDGLCGFFGEDESEEKEQVGSNHKCICGNILVIKTASKCYQQGDVYCDVCRRDINPDANVYHCTKGKIAEHESGCDICEECVKQGKYSPQMTFIVPTIYQCKCGREFMTKIASTCYKEYGGRSVVCMDCHKNMDGNDAVYHCPSNETTHKFGYDVCAECIHGYELDPNKVEPKCICGGVFTTYPANKNGNVYCDICRQKISPGDNVWKCGKNATHNFEYEICEECVDRQRKFTYLDSIYGHLKSKAVDGDVILNLAEYIVQEEFDSDSLYLDTDINNKCEGNVSRNSNNRCSSIIYNFFKRNLIKPDVFRIFQNVRELEINGASFNRSVIYPCSLEFLLEIIVNTKLNKITISTGITGILSSTPSVWLQSLESSTYFASMEEKYKEKKFEISIVHNVDGSPQLVINRMKYV